MENIEYLKKELEIVRSWAKHCSDECDFYRKLLNESVIRNHEHRLVDLDLNFSLKDDVNNRKQAAITCLLRAGYISIENLAGKNIYELVNIPHCGAFSSALVLIILEHYGLQIEHLDPKDAPTPSIAKKVKNTYKLLPEISQRIEFI